MCGIVGLFLKDASLQTELGSMLSDMLVTMSDRGPDSAGIAIYGDQAGSGKNGNTPTDIAKITLQSATPDTDFDGLEAALSKMLASKISLQSRDTHAVLALPRDMIDAARTLLADLSLIHI